MVKQRQTIQKLKILEYLKSVKTHPNVETIYTHVKKQLPTITLATIYRNLNLMADNGEILKLEINNEFRFDGDTSHHQHCVCKKCGIIIDGCQENINEYALKHIKSDKFTPLNVNIIFNGYCKKCGRK